MIATRRLYIILFMVLIPFSLSGIWPILRTGGLALDVVLALILLIDFQLTQKPGLLTVSRMTVDRLSIGKENEVTIKVTNTGSSRLEIRLKDDRPEGMASDVEEFEFILPPDSVSTLTYSLVPRRRGLYVFGDINLRYQSFLGLFWRQVSLPQPEEVRVYSDLKALYELSIKLAKSSELGELHQRKRGQGTDFASLKEYTVGDDAKAIDWKATARRERPVVRTYEAEQEQRLLILIDAGRMMMSDLEGLTRFDHALNAALCLALTGLSHNDQVGIGIFADKPLLYLPPRRGKSYMKKILEASFSVEPRMVEPDYMGMLAHFAMVQKGRSLTVVFTDLTDPVGSQALLGGLAALSGRNLPFCVTLKDRQVSQIARPTEFTEKSNSEEVIERIYKRAIASDVLEQRELALSVLQRRGCLVLDCPPQELSEKIVDSYLEIKTRARL